MNGECKSYRLNEPMKYEEFKAMPDDIKISYITLLRKKFNCPDSKIGEMMGANKDKISRQFIKLGLDKGKTRKKENWDKEGFYAWVHGVSKLPTTGIEEPIETPVVEEAPIQEACFEIPDYKETEGIQDSKFTEDDLPFEEPQPIHTKLPELHIALCAEIDELRKRNEELLKTNEELMAVHELDKQEIAWLRKEHDSLQWTVKMREAQLEIVQLIFGGQNRG